MIELQNILEIENELEDLLSADKKSWIRIYELMETVDNEKLYVGKFSSYTAWVNALATKAKVHVSLLWNRKKAGKVYAAYQKRAKENGRTVPAMEEVKVSADNFNLIEKIAGRNEKVADELIDKVLQGDMKRADLKNAWAMVKANREASGSKTARVNAYDKEEVITQQESITSADIVLALSSATWMDPEDIYLSTYSQGKYKLVTEFAVQTGTTHHARRVDALVLENYTVKKEKNYNVNLHAIEIKVDKRDLLEDHKMQEYTDYADYFWIAIPEYLEEYAREIMLPEWGLLLLNEQKELQIAVKAKRHNAVFRKETIETALVKFL